jgi:hypothetical protein
LEDVADGRVGDVRPEERVERRVGVDGSVGREEVSTKRGRAADPAERFSGDAIAEGFRFSMLRVLVEGGPSFC